MTWFQALFGAGLIGIVLLFVDELLLFFKDKEPRRRTLRQFGLFGVCCGLVGLFLVIVLYALYAG